MGVEVFQFQPKRSILWALNVSLMYGQKKKCERHGAYKEQCMSHKHTRRGELARGRTMIIVHLFFVFPKASHLNFSILLIVKESYLHQPEERYENPQTQSTCTKLLIFLLKIPSS